MSSKSNNTAGMKFYQLSDVFFALRDAYAERAVSVNRPREVGYRSIVQFAVDNYENLDVARSFLEDEFQSRNLSNFKATVLRDNLVAKKPVEQIYMVCRILDKTDDTEDQRARDFFIILSQSGLSLPTRCYLTPFFRSRFGDFKRSSRSYFRDVLPATPFSIILYLSHLLYIMKKKESTRNKRRRVAGGTKQAVFLESLQNFGVETCQGTGFIVGRVLYAWDMFSRFVGFANVEEMVSPYILFDAVELMYHVIDSRTSGYAPSSHRTQLDEDVLPVSEGSDFLSILSDETDGTLRVLAKEFLKNVHILTTHERLYSLNPESREVWDTLEQLKPDMERRESDPNHTRRHPYPERFDRFAEGIWKPVKQEMENFKLAAKDAMEVEPSQEVVHPVVDLVSSDDDFEETVSNPHVGYNVEETGIMPPQVPNNRSLHRAFGHLDTVMRRSFCALYQCDQQNLEVTHDSLSTESNLAFGDAQLVLTDPPYNTRRLQGKQNSDHDVLTEDDMERTVATVNAALRPGGHFIIFCSIEQFTKWLLVFNDAVRRVESVRIEDGSRKPVTRYRPIFRVDQAPMVFVRDSGYHTRNPTRTSSLVSVTEYAIHGVKRGLTASEERSRISLDSHSFIPSTLEAFKNVVDKVPRPSRGELLTWRVRDNAKWTPRYIRPEQKPRELMKELICRFTRPGDTVVDLFSGTFSTAMACLSIPQHRKFIGCESDDACFSHAQHHVLIAVARAIEEGHTDMMVDQSTLQAARRVVEAFPVAVRVERTWRPPRGFPPYQRIPGHMVVFLENLWMDASFRNAGLLRSVCDWHSNFQGALHRMEPKTLLAQDAINYRLRLSPSTIKHPKAGRGVFAALPVQEGDVICHFYGTLVYHDLSERDEVHSMYGNGILGVTSQRFRKYCMEAELDGDIFLSLVGNAPGDRKKPVVWVVPAPFCIGGFINDARYIDGDAEQDLFYEEGFRRRAANVVIRRTKGAVSTIKAIEAPELLSVVAITNIETNEELFVDYGTEYDWKRNID